MGETAKKVLTIVLSVILWAVILLAALFAFTTLATKEDGQVANFLGFTPLSVKTESMSPTIEAGDLIFIKKCDPDTLQVGDIITFHTIIENKYALNTHRIVEIEDLGPTRSYVTKGDNNALSDEHTIIDSDIVGKYIFKINGLGKVMDFLSSSTGFLVCIVLPMLVFFIYQVYHLVMIGMKMKKAEAIEAAEEAAKIQAEALEKAKAEAATASQSSAADDETARLRAELEEAKRKLAEAEAAKSDDIKKDE